MSFSFGPRNCVIFKALFIYLFIIITVYNLNFLYTKFALLNMRRICIEKGLVRSKRLLFEIKHLWISIRNNCLLVHWPI